MAQNLLLGVSPEFDFPTFVQRLSDTYRAKGYTTNIMDMGGNFSMVIEKDTSGLTHLLGMSESIRVNMIVGPGPMGENTLSINFAEEAWIGKILALVVGWIVCCIPFITGIIGCVRQYSLPNNISNDVRMIVAGM